MIDGCTEPVRSVRGDRDAGGYALEERSHWFILAFAGACALGSAYGFLQGAWPFGLVEAIWAGVALRRWISGGDDLAVAVQAGRKTLQRAVLMRARGG